MDPITIMLGLAGAGLLWRKMKRRTLTVDQWAAARKVNPSIPRAILRVESGGLPRVLADGRPLTRFETHLFLREHPEAREYFKHSSGKAWEDQAWRPSSSAAWRPLHTGDWIEELSALELAAQLNEEAAYRSASYGAGQVLGSNHKRAGYPSASAMYAAMHDPAEQERAFTGFLDTTPGLVAAAQRGDLLEVARLYNGTGQPDKYAAKLAAAGATGLRGVV